jgi:ER lumen protein retaining receptor
MSSSFSTTFESTTNALSKTPPAMVAAYSSFLGGGAMLYYVVRHTQDAFSAVITVAEMLQCLALILLAAQVLSSGSVQGISARTVGLEAFALVLKLSSTLNYNGYLPVDESGDWFYQGVDICGVIAALWVLYQAFVAKRASYQSSDDTFPVIPIVLGSILLAAIFHADMNARPVYDTLWMSGLFLGSVAVMPQLWLITRSGGNVEALMSHYIAVMATGRLLAGYFMWLAREDVTSQPWIEGFNHAILAVLAAHLLNLLLLGDFAFYYIKALATQGLNCKLDFEGYSILV